MASRSPYLINLKKNRIGVAVYGNFANELNVSRFFALHPDLLPGSAPIVGFRGLDSLVHASSFMYASMSTFPLSKVLDDHGKQTVLFTKIRSQRRYSRLFDFKPPSFAPSLDVRILDLFPGAATSWPHAHLFHFRGFLRIIAVRFAFRKTS